MPEAVKELPPSVLAAILAGQKIEAIKLLRHATGLGLKESKDAVEAYIQSRPELSERYAAAQEEAKRGLFRWVLILAAVGIIATVYSLLR